MTDLEITKLCAEAMGYLPDVVLSSIPLFCHLDGATDSKGFDYDPIQDDAQAMALVKKLEISIDNPHRADAGEWRASMFGAEGTDASLNRAICECVAKMQKQKEG